MSNTTSTKGNGVLNWIWATFGGAFLFVTGIVIEHFVKH